jgi:transcriptional regulator with XRE-family HTH domain
MIAAIGNRIRNLRRENNLSQKEVAHKLFISQAAYSLMETSHNGIISEHVVRLSEIYNVTTDFILKGNTKLIEMDVKNDFLPFISAKAHAGFIKKMQDDEITMILNIIVFPGLIQPKIVCL